MNADISGLHFLIRKLWRYFNKGVSVYNAYKDCMLQKDFEYPDVCFNTITYWYQFFLQNSTLDEDTLYLIDVTNLQLFISKLVLDNPNWTTAHYIDASRVDFEILRNCMRNIGYSYCHNKWIKIT
ncbi:hypothetical protein M0802_014172 [Mischocyttarus mexicanus]|nr:hypothetical protein M0802_014311 [Mischocyttarus mexicanus]KAI4480481.1 hypothetical protein M0802_014172 [Mischocyttarus mexicanus]